MLKDGKKDIRIILDTTFTLLLNLTGWGSWLWVTVTGMHSERWLSALEQDFVSDYIFYFPFKNLSPAFFAALFQEARFFLVSPSSQMHMLPF